MSNGVLKYETIKLAQEFEPVLFKRTTGQAVAERFRALSANTVVAASFEGVEAVGSSFLKVALLGLKNICTNYNGHPQYQRAPILVFTDTIPEIDYELELSTVGTDAVVPGVAVGRNGIIEVLTRRDRVSKTFTAAKELTAGSGDFRVGELAKKIQAGCPETNTNLNFLRQAGIVTRWHEWYRGGAPRYEYRTLTDEDLTRFS